jgi:hypothetical protein
VLQAGRVGHVACYIAGRADEDADYRWQLSVKQAEFSTTMALDRPTCGTSPPPVSGSSSATYEMASSSA